MENNTIQLLTHASKRAAQRGISLDMIKTTVNYGEVHFKQGLRYFVCLEKHLIGIVAKPEIEKYKNTVVILNAQNEIITCYKNKNACSHIKRKTKILYKNNRYN